MDRTPQVFAPPSVHDARPSPYDHPALAEKFRPIFQRIADTVLERERTRTLPFEPITWLKQAGFGAVRVRSRSSTVSAMRWKMGRNFSASVGWS